MIEGRSFLYQDFGGTVYHISENGVQVIQTWPAHKIVAFVDGDRDRFEPNPILFSAFVQIILATYPQGANRKWRDQTAGSRAIVISPWSRQEFFIAGFV
jgi:hypothetical protein